MTHYPIKSFTYHELQKLARKWNDTVSKSFNIRLNISKEVLYRNLRDNAQISYNIEPISVYIPAETMEHILSFSEDEMYTILAITSKYWYDRSQSPVSMWWKKRYYLLGGYFPPENTIPFKVLYDQFSHSHSDSHSRRHGDTLVRLTNNQITTDEISLSTDITNRCDLTIIKTCKAEYLTILSSHNKIAKTAGARKAWGKEKLWIDENGNIRFDEGYISLYQDIKQICGYYVLTNRGRLYCIDINAYRANPNASYINTIDVPPMKDITYFSAKLYGLTYDHKIYKIDLNTHEYKHELLVSHTLFDELPKYPISMKGDGAQMYLISEHKIYCMIYGEELIYDIKLSSPVEHIVGEYDCNEKCTVIYYTSKNKLYIRKPNSAKPIEYILDLKYIVGMTLSNNGLCILGKK